MLRIRCLSLLLAGSALYAQPDNSFYIVSVAGNGVQGYSGDGGAATSAKLNYPKGVTLDISGNLYIAESGSHRIRKVTANGIISTVAGSGGLSFTGDGGPAISANLNEPCAVAVDASGTLYIADCGDHRIRKITPRGIISTVAGNGVRGHSGDGGPATAASLSRPYDVTFDAAGNLYIADSGSSRIRKVTANGIISTVAGGGGVGFAGDGGPATSASLITPVSIALDSLSNLYIADSNRIRKVTPAGIIRTVVGNGKSGFSDGDGGPAILATMNGLAGIAVDATGTLYIVDNVRIRRVTPDGLITTVAGNGQSYSTDDEVLATDASLNWPGKIVVGSGGSIFLAEPGGARVRELVPSHLTPGCVYAIDRESQAFTPSGGSGSVAVLTDKVGCAWPAESNAAWTTIVSGRNGIGNGVVTYSVQPNPSSVGRAGTIRIAGRLFRVNQTGLVCSYSIDPDRVSIPAGGAIGNMVNVTANAPDCGWSTSGIPSWILVSGGNSGIGNGTVTYTVGINTGGFRTGTIKIAGQAVSVNQAPAGVGPPIISAEVVLNAAASLAGALAPGEFASVYGLGLGPAQGVPSKSMEKGLGTTRVFFNGIEAFLTYVSAGQVNALVPYGIAGSDRADLQVEYQAMKSNIVSLPAAKAAPGIFTQQYGPGQAWVVNQDQTFNSDKNPAERGSYVAFWATGQGLVDPAGKDGEAILAPNFPKPKLPVTATVGGVNAEVLFTGLIYTGVMQVNVKLPDNVPVGNAVELLLKVGDFTSRSGVTLAVR